MSALTDIFTALANKIRSKTGTQTTYTPAQMVSDGIDDVYDAGYAAGGGGSSATPITPSNSSPASMSAGTAYEPTVNGYAIESYSSVTPSNSSPVDISSGSIYKASAAGKAIASLSEITPSNTNPVTLSSGSIYKMGDNGKAVKSITNIQPSNTSPVSLSPLGIYSPNFSGYAIFSYANRTPSDSSPVELTSGNFYNMGGNGYAIQSYSSPSQAQLDAGYYFPSGFVKMPSSGYAYSSQLKACKTGSVTLSTSTTTSVTLGFEPKFICVWTYKDASHMNSVIYNSSLSTSKQMNGAMNGSTTSAAYNDMPYTSTGVGRINSINSTGFVIGKANTTFGTTAYYFAIG